MAILQIDNITTFPKLNKGSKVTGVKKTPPPHGVFLYQYSRLCSIQQPDKHNKHTHTQAHLFDVLV